MPLNVKDFGAMGDGVTDDTAAILAALDTLMAVPKGGTLYFPKGIYIVKYTIQLVGAYGHNYTIIGDG
jgi:polygalacturonase